MSKRTLLSAMIGSFLAVVSTSSFAGGNVVVVDEAGGDSYMVGPNGDAEVKFKVHKEDTNNTYEVITEDHPIGFKSEPHVHTTGSETFFIIKGEYDYRIGDKTGSVSPGAVIHVPPNTVHVMHAKQGGRVLMIYSPPELEKRTKAITSMSPEEAAKPGAIQAKLAEHGHVSVEGDHGHDHDGGDE